MSKEKTELESIITKAQTEMNKSSEKLTELRDKEQELISTSGTSVSTLSEFDKQLSERNEKERTITNDINKLVLELDGLKRDLAEIKTEESSLCKILNVFELDPSIETFDVRPSIEMLEKEQNSLAASLNTIAPRRYVEISTGYRSMSSRKNNLEEERNAVVAVSYTHLTLPTKA